MQMVLTIFNIMFVSKCNILVVPFTFYVMFQYVAGFLVKSQIRYYPLESFAFSGPMQGILE